MHIITKKNQAKLIHLTRMATPLKAKLEQIVV